MKTRRLMLAVVMAAWVMVAIKTTCSVSFYQGSDPSFKAIWVHCGPFIFHASLDRMGSVSAIAGRVSYVGN